MSQPIHLERINAKLRSSCLVPGIVGTSQALVDVLHQVELVAPTPTTVLILGETGTGKELISKAIHARSPRAGSALVKVNCSAIPSTLLESELFGHEKGAFTGAMSRRIGRFEQAKHGSILLDEIGELPLEVQPKLLRLLQEREYQRLGSNRTEEADIRLIVATHRDLHGMCRAGTFRADLFYRLNVFPIRMPALRERREDIPVLVAHFVALLARRLGKDVRTVSSAALRTLESHDWPGNVRELENVLERAVIRCTGSELEVDCGNGFEGYGASPRELDQSFEAATRAHIVSVLKSTKGVVGGPHGAAARLGLKRSTLNFKLKKLGIEPAEVRAG
ncbi:MAG TPA: sigma 54-interacting transcriptional regulator [Polyangiaceae bacterium]|nr:sigma 54-interacting transcriptional regulator [Polyangiaceae bacterium]